MWIRPSKRTVILGVVFFVLLPLLIGGFMYIKMMDVLHDYMEQRVRAQTESLTELASLQLSEELEDLENVASYFDNGRVDEPLMERAAGALLGRAGRMSYGILRIDNTPVFGEALNAQDLSVIRDVFRGTSTVRYRRGEGVLFAAPIFNNKNIKYVLYEFLSEDALFGGFNESCFNARGQVMMVDRGQEIILPIDGSITEKDEYFRKKDVQEALLGLAKKMETASTAASYYSVDSQESFVYVGRMEQSKLYLFGIVPYSAVTDGIPYLIHTVLIVFGLLMVLLIVGLIRVITADSKTREVVALRQAKVAMEEADRSKSNFLASMSHELRTPLNVIMGLDEMILRETREVSTKEFAMDIKSAGQTLLGLMNDVLDFSKIESGNLKIVPMEYDLILLLRDLSLLADSRARAKSLAFEIHVQPDLPKGLYGDDLRIQQILTNLVTNAIKYTQEGTVDVYITGKKTENDSIILHCEVRDTGIGIKEEDIPKLFMPYVRIEEARNRKVEGSGLGITIITKLLEQMGSKLNVDSVYGKGSTFYFDLEQEIVDSEPIGNLQERMAEQIRNYDYRVSCIAPKAKILMVDDNAMNRRIFTSLLKATKISITTVSSGKKCLELVQKEHFDIIFMDHLMPEMDGVDTLNCLKGLTINQCRDTPVIALTANAFSGAEEKYISLGFDGFLAKPIVSEQLEKLICKLLPEEYLEEAPRAEEPKMEESIDNKLEKLPKIDGVNWGFALLHISDVELLMKTLRDFYNGIDTEYRENLALMEEISTQKGMDDYLLRVHAMKSTAALMGILTVSELARVLEAAAKAEDQERIRHLNPIFLEELLKMKERLKPFVGQSEEKQELEDRSELLALLEMLRIAMQGMDIGQTDSIMEQIRSYRYEGDLQEKMEKLSGLISELDYDGAGELVNKILEELL